MSAVPDVSVVVPTFNRAHVLGVSLASLLSETGVDLELIADLLYGPVHYRFLISATPVDPPLAEQVVDAVMAQWGPGRRRAGKHVPGRVAEGTVEAELGPVVVGNSAVVVAVRLRQSLDRRDHLLRHLAADDVRDDAVTQEGSLHHPVRYSLGFRSGFSASQAR